MLIGIRRFETINLAYGEATGDGALIEVATRLARLAGEGLNGPWFAARGPGGHSC
jgi:GGDEF domain-containing protein